MYIPSASVVLQEVGLSVEFFRFERARTPLFLRGCVAGDSSHLKHDLRVPDFEDTETPLPFILHLRRVCETIFDTMLCAYISGLKAYHERSRGRGEKEGSKRASFDGWDQALKSAGDALTTFRATESLRHKGDLDFAVQEALCALQKRYHLHLRQYSLLCLSSGAIPILYSTKLIMTGWDDDQVRKV